MCFEIGSRSERAAGGEVVEYADAVVAPQQLFDDVGDVEPASPVALRRISTNSDPLYSEAT
jgi:hypothetical protein